MTQVSLGDVANELFETNTPSLDVVFGSAGESAFARKDAGNWHNYNNMGQGNNKSYAEMVWLSYNNGTNYELGNWAYYDHEHPFVIAVKYELSTLDPSTTLRIKLEIDSTCWGKVELDNTDYNGGSLYSLVFVSLDPAFDVVIEEYCHYRLLATITQVSGGPETFVKDTSTGSDTDDVGPDKIRYYNHAFWDDVNVTTAQSEWILDGDDTGGLTIAGNKRSTLELAFYQ